MDNDADEPTGVGRGRQPRPAGPVRFAYFRSVPMSEKDAAAEAAESDRHSAVMEGLRERVERAGLASRFDLCGASFDLNGSLTGVRVQASDGFTQADIGDLETTLDGIAYRIEPAPAGGEPLVP